MGKQPFASLHSGLLARKGHASPAFQSAAALAANNAYDAPPSPASNVTRPEFERRDIPQNTVDRTPIARPLKGLTPSRTPSNEETHEPADGDGDAKCILDCKTELEEAPTPVEETGKAKTRYKISARINSEQRRRLRILAALFDWPNQKILSDALDSYLDSLYEQESIGCSCLKKRAPAESQ